MESLEYEMLSYINGTKRAKMLSLQKVREFFKKGVDINKRLDGKGQNMSLFENLAEFGVDCPEIVALFIKKGGDLFTIHVVYNVNVINTLFGNGEHECNWGRSSSDYEKIMDLIIKTSDEKHYPEIANVLCTSPSWRGSKCNAFLFDQLNEVLSSLEVEEYAKYFEKAKEAYNMGPIVYFTEFEHFKLDDEYIQDLVNETELGSYDKIIEFVKDNSSFFD
jgi:hypothetical protein